MKSDHRSAILPFVLGIAAVLGLSLLAGRVVPDWRFLHEPLHSAVEAAGGLAAILMAMFLLQRTEEPHGGRMVMLALGFSAMGILDIAHSVSQPGQSFVLLRTAASLAGGIGFLLVCLPQNVLATAAARRWQLLGYVCAAVVLFAVWVLFSRVRLPLMTSGDRFTPLAISLNLAAGICFVIAAVRLLCGQKETEQPRILLLVGMAFLFGVANLMFPFSMLWDYTWWMWHLVRLLSYGIVLYVLVSDHQATLGRLTEALKERESAEAALRELNQTLEGRVRSQTSALRRSNEELTQFAYLASHDLQEPLRAVTGFLEILRERKSEHLDDTAKGYVKKAHDGAVRMKELIQDLLAYSRVGTEAKSLVPTDSRAVVDRVLGDLRFAIEEANAKVLCEPLPKVNCDARQLGQVFQNLVSNALKFRGATPPTIRISAKRSSGSWQFSVADNGIGIMAEFADRIFEMFKRLHTRQEYPGSGIGLAICRRIVTRHGGKIWVESSEGNGATFHFTIPAVPPGQVGTEPQQADPSNS